MYRTDIDTALPSFSPRWTRWHVHLALALLLALSAAPSYAKQDFLPAHEAFQVTSETRAGALLYAFKIAPGYYLYQQRFSFESVGDAAVTLGEPEFARQGEWKDDPAFGRVRVFHEDIEVTIPIVSAETDFIEVEATFQGCAEQGLCYLPQSDLNMFQVVAATPAADPSEVMTTLPTEQSLNPQSLNTRSATSLEAFLDDANLLAAAGIFFLIGLGLTFTPCVLPMIPILSSLIAGQESLTRRRGALLSLTYVLAMSVTYAGLGVAAGLTGASLQVALQNPVVLIVVAVLFVLLALSMLGFYELQLPRAVHDRLHQLSHRQSGGTYIGVAIIGIISALVVSPCVSAPLAGALLYIGQSGDWLLGGTALWSLGLGMGVPLLIIGVTETNILPKAGRWMESIKGLFGVMLLAVALWLVKHLLPDLVLALAAAFLLILAGLLCGALRLSTHPKGELFQALGITLLVAGVGVALQPFFSSTSNPKAAPVTETARSPFTMIRAQTDLANALTNASARGEGVMLDFYADWCTSCLEMEHETFADAGVQQRLAHLNWLQVDLTNNPEAMALLAQFGIPGPPALLFFDADGTEIEAARSYAYLTRDEFMAHINQYLPSESRQTSAN